jgi:SAM-dependent methyltransferase
MSKWTRFRAKLKQDKLLKKYQAHAYDKTFDWDWRAIAYNRIALVNLLVAKFPDCDYLEIGCAGNNLFDSVPVKKKTGVDPARGGTVRKTSDDFFAGNTAKFDVIFIDGLHEYEQVHKDVANAIQAVKPGGWVALHDMLPRTWVEHHVPNISNTFWTGDVWKVAFELAQTKGVDFRLLKIDHGVGVFRLSEPAPKLADLSSELRDKEFGYLYENIGKLPVTDWQDAQGWLARS